MALLAAGFLPLGLAYFAEAWGKPWYRWFPLALLAALALAVRALTQARQAAKPGADQAWVSLVFCGVGLLGLASAVWSPWLGWLALLVTLPGVIGWCGGKDLFRRLVPAYVLLVVCLSPPLDWDVTIVNRLERLLLSGADRLLYTLGGPHLVSAVGVTLPRLNVPHAGLYTGLHGLPAVLVLGLVFLLWMRRGPLRVCLTLVLSSLLFLPCESVRLARGLAACDETGTNFFLTAKSTQSVVGWWLLYALLLVSMDQFVRFLVVPRNRAETGEAPEFPPEPPPWPGWGAVLGMRPVASRLAWGLALAGVALAGVQVVRAWQKPAGMSEAARLAAVKLKPGAVFRLPDWDGFHNLRETNSLAQLPRVGTMLGAWYRQRQDLAMAVGLSGPMMGFPSPLLAAQEQGWELRGWEATRNETRQACARAELVRDAILRGILWFGVVDAAGRWVEAPARLGRDNRASVENQLGPCYLLQTIVVSTRNLTPAELGEVRERFEVARAELARQLAAEREEPR